MKILQCQFQPNFERVESFKMYSYEKSQPSAWGYANDAVNYSWEWHFNLFAPESFTTEVPELL